MSNHLPRGNPQRMAFIHSVYALAWAAGALAAATPRFLGAAVLLVSALDAVFAAAVLRRKEPARPKNDPGTAAAIRTINLATAGAAIAAVVVCHQAGADRRMIPAVLLVMAVHFVPLWRLLRRISLLVMGIALLLAAMAAFFASSPAVAALMAAIIFLTNSLRILIHPETE